MHFHPTDIVENTCRGCRFLGPQFLIELIFWEINKFPIVRQFLNKIVHRCNVATE